MTSTLVSYTTEDESKDDPLSNLKNYETAYSSGSDLEFNTAVQKLSKIFKDSDTSSKCETLAPSINSSIQRSVSFYEPSRDVLLNIQKSVTSSREEVDKLFDEIIKEMEEENDVPYSQTTTPHHQSNNNNFVNSTTNSSSFSATNTPTTPTNRTHQQQQQPVLTEKDWQDLIKRVTKPSEKKLKLMQTLLEEKEKKLLEECQFKPTINERSKRMTTGQDFITRQEEKLKSKLEKIKSIQEKLEKAKEEALTFNPNINAMSKSMNRGIKSFELWEKERVQRIQSKVRNQKNQEVEGCTFRPSLSQRSIKLMREDRRNVVERNLQFEQDKNQKLLQELEREIYDARKPNITQKASSMEREEPVGERLYKLGMKSIKRRKKKIKSYLLSNYHSSSLSIRDLQTSDTEDEIQKHQQQQQQPLVTFKNDFEFLFDYEADEDDDWMQQQNQQQQQPILQDKGVAGTASNENHLGLVYQSDYHNSDAAEQSEEENDESDDDSSSEEKREEKSVDSMNHLPTCDNSSSDDSEEEEIPKLIQEKDFIEEYFSENNIQESVIEKTLKTLLRYREHNQQLQQQQHNT